MIVIGADTHKSTHTLAAVDAATGRVVATRTVAADRDGMLAAWRWAHRLDGERVWALEDCRHVSGRLERCLVGQGERAVRVAPKLMGQTRRGARRPGRSDEIDAIAVARAALQEGVDTLPIAFLDEPAFEIRLLCDHRADLVAERTRRQNRLRWHLVELDADLEAALPTRALDRECWLDRIAGRLAAMTQTARVRVARDELRRIGELTRAERALERELIAAIRALRRAARRRRRRRDHRRDADRAHRRRAALPDRRALRPPGRRSADPGCIRSARADPLEPWRRSPAQLRAAPHRGDQGSHRPRDRCLPRPQAVRGQDPPRGLPLPQAPPRPPRLQAPAANTPDVTSTAQRPPAGHQQAGRHDPLQHATGHPGVDIDGMCRGSVLARV